MSKKIVLETPIGVRDYGPDEMSKRSLMLSKIRNIFELYNAVELDTSIFEFTNILQYKYGEDEKLIFNLKDDKISLRYDLTVPFARFVVNNKNNITFPFKRYQMQNVWRADRPQKGRFREFYQCDADVIGSKSLFNEIELIQLCDDIFSDLNIPNVEILINNRKILSAMIEMMSSTNIFNDFVIILDKLEKIGIENVKNELVKIGVQKDKLNILDSFLNIRDVNDFKALLNDSEIGSKGVAELDFIIKNIYKKSI